MIGDGVAYPTAEVGLVGVALDIFGDGFLKDVGDVTVLPLGDLLDLQDDTRR